MPQSRGSHGRVRTLTLLNAAREPPLATHSAIVSSSASFGMSLRLWGRARTRPRRPQRRWTGHSRLHRRQPLAPMAFVLHRCQIRVAAPVEGFNDPKQRPNPPLEEAVTAGRPGRKSECRFTRYDGGGGAAQDAERRRQDENQTLPSPKRNADRSARTHRLPDRGAHRSAPTRWLHARAGPMYPQCATANSTRSSRR